MLIKNLKERSTCLAAGVFILPKEVYSLADLWTREWLRKQGYSDPDIGWENETVTLKGQPFLTPAYETGGKSYAPLTALQSALRTYKLGEQESNISKQLKALQNQRFDYTAADAARSPEYKAAQRLSEKQAKRDIATAAERLGEYGIASSSSMGTQAGRITEAAGDKLAQMIPGIIQSRLTQYNQERADQMNLLNTLVALQNAYRGQANLEETTAYERERQAAREPLELQLLQAQIASAQRAANAPYSTASPKAAPTLLDIAKLQAYNDPRLWTGEGSPPEGRWTLDDLTNAYLASYNRNNNNNVVINPIGFDPEASNPNYQWESAIWDMINMAKSMGYTKDQIRQGIIEEGADPGKYGY